MADLARFTAPLPFGPRPELVSDSSSFKKITSTKALMAGWHKVRQNQGASGGDHVTVNMFSQNLSSKIKYLQQKLRSGDYRPGPLRHVDIPKRSGGVRTLSIPCIADRIVQSSAAQTLSPLFEAEFEDISFAYRPGRSVTQAVHRVSAAQRAGFDWIVDADIQDFFGSVRHDALMQRWQESVDTGPLTQLIGLWLTFASPEGIGLPQGSPLSPLLANLFLDRLDEKFIDHPHFRFIRFADDFVILAKSKNNAARALSDTRDWLHSVGLQLNMDKTRILDFDKGLRFLGHLFVRSLVTKTVYDSSGTDADTLDFMRKIARADSDAEKEKIALAEKDEAIRKAGYSPGFRVLYVYEAGRRLHYRNKSFTVEEFSDNFGPSAEQNWDEIIAIPHHRIDRIEIGPKATLSLAARDLALATQTPIAYVDGRGQTKGWTSMELAPRAKRHMAQAACALDPEKRLELASVIVEGRVRSQRAVLRRLIRSRTDIKPVIDSVSSLNQVIGWGDRSRIRHAESIPELMGLEGQAAAAWWKGIWRLMPLECRPTSRLRGDAARDGTNAMLNLFSWLLHRDVSIAVIRAGLHPGFGILHTSQDRKDAAVYDIMEGFRAHFVGGLSVYCTNKRVVVPSDFVVRENGVDIKTKARSALIRTYEKRAARLIKSPQTGKRINWRQLMLEQALDFAAHIEGGERFCPYEMGY